MRRIALLCGCILALAIQTTEPRAAAEAVKGVEVLAHVSPGEDINGQIWAHRGFAYLGSYGNASTRCTGGVRVYDLRSPRRPRRVAVFARNSSVSELAGTYTDQVRVQHAETPSFSGDLAVVGLQRCRAPFEATGGTRGFALYDVSEPVRPRLLSIVDTLPAHGAHELWLQTTGAKAYVYTAIPRAELHTSPDGVTPGNPDFRIYDVSNPAQPVQVGAWGLWGNLGVPPTHEQYVHSVIVNAGATRAFLSYWNFGTVILDISDPTRPRLLGVARDPGQRELPHAHSAALMKGGRILVETQEFGRFFGFTGTGYPRFYDISDPARPRLLSRFAPAGTRESTVHDARPAGDRLYLSWYDEGVWTLDVSDPAAPRKVAHFVPSAGSDPQNTLCPRCTFVWGVFPYGDLVLASDMNSGLWVLHVRCSVPRVTGLRLAAARAALAKADCHSGRIRRVRSSRHGRVLGQSRQAGSRPAYPARIGLTVGQ